MNEMSPLARLFQSPARHGADDSGLPRYPNGAPSGVLRPDDSGMPRYPSGVLRPDDSGLPRYPNGTSVWSRFAQDHKPSIAPQSAQGNQSVWSRFAQDRKPSIAPQPAPRPALGSYSGARTMTPGARF